MPPTLSKLVSHGKKSAAVNELPLSRTEFICLYNMVERLLVRVEEIDAVIQERFPYSKRLLERRIREEDDKDTSGDVADPNNDKSLTMDPDDFIYNLKATGFMSLRDVNEYLQPLRLIAHRIWKNKMATQEEAITLQHYCNNLSSTKSEDRHQLIAILHKVLTHPPLKMGDTIEQVQEKLRLKDSSEFTTFLPKLARVIVDFIYFNRFCNPSMTLEGIVIRTASSGSGKPSITKESFDMENIGSEILITDTKMVNEISLMYRNWKKNITKKLKKNTAKKASGDREVSSMVVEGEEVVEVDIEEEEEVEHG